VTGGGLYQFSTKAKKMKIFISFNYTDDNRYRNLLNALAKNTNSPVEFEDYTPSEINSYDVGRIKAALSRRINDSEYTLVVIGENANQRHPDYIKIGTRNWQWWEIEKAAEAGHKFIAVKIKNSNPTPDPLLGKRATWARTYNVEAIAKAIDDA
jgi:hypothetical protein